MGNLPSMDSSNAWARLRRDFDALDQRLSSFMTAAGTLASATISKGSLIIKGGGNLDVIDNGRIRVIGTSSTATLEQGRMGMVSLDFNGALTYPSCLLQVDGFLADAGPGIGNAVYRVDSAGAAVVSSSANMVKLSYTTTGVAANVRMLTDGTIQMVTSSLRYKQDVDDAVIDPADVLALRGRTWRQRTDVENDPDTTQRNIGFIAEELDSLPSMRQFVIYDEQARPDSIQYDRITVALHAVVKDQAAQIAALTARVTALEATAPKP